MKRLIGIITIASIVLLSITAAKFVTSGASPANSPRSASTMIPVPVQEALTIVESSRNAGPLTVDPTGGSVVGGVWTSTTTGQSVGVTQHWSLRASDNSGTIVLGINVSDSGTEVVGGWVPGTSQSTNWIFNAADPSLATTYQVTVPGTTQTISSSSPNTQSSLDSGTARPINLR